MQLKVDLPVIFVLLFLCGISSGYTQSPESHQEWLEKGWEAEKNGEYEKALDIWFEGRVQLNIPSVAIGTEFIRMTTEKNLNNYYKPAHLMYMWGLEAKEIDPNEDALRNELQRLKPIVKPNLYEEWNKLLDEGDPKLYTEIRKFWERKNYLPDLRYNPRLIEHWERIAYVKRHFGDPLDSTSTADARIAHYIRFGKPDREIIKNLTSEMDEVTDFGYEFMESRYGIEYQWRMLEFTAKISEKVALSEKNPKVNIWAYEADKVDTNRNLILIFREMKNGHYERINSVGNLIPISAFTQKTGLTTGRLGNNRSFLYGLPGITLQYLYYSKLKNFDSFFGQQTELMKNELFKTISENIDETSYGLPLFNRINYEQNRNYQSAATDRSVSQEELPEIPLEIYQYRLLDKSDTPVYATFVESNPTRAYVRDYAAHKGKTGYDPNTSSMEISLEENYQLQHIFKQVDESDQPIGQVAQNSSLKFEGEELSGTSAFIVPKAAGSVKQIMYSVLKNRDSAFDYGVSPNPPGLIGLGKTEFNQPEHFEMEPEKLTAGDLIIGYGRDSSAATESLFPFTVSNDRKIPEDENLVVHFEVYHLETDDEGFSRFEVDYSFDPVSGFFSRFSQEDSDQNFTLFFEPKSSWFSESLEIKTEALEVGEYDLDFTITDLTDGEQVERSVRFEVVENKISEKTSAID